MKRCLHISANQYPSLDKQHFTKRIWQELAKGFDEYHVLARSKDNAFEHFQEGNIHLHLVPALGSRSRSFILSSIYLFYLVKKFRITHMLAQSALLGGITAALASKIYRIPLMCEIHGDSYFKYLRGRSLADRLLARLILFVFNQSRFVRSLSPSMTNKLEELGVNNIAEIPNRVDSSIFSPSKSDYEIGEVLKLVSIGRFVWEKNFLNLMRVLHESKMRFQLTLVGGGPLRPDYEKYISENNLEKNVCLVDWVRQDELVSLITNSDIYIQYSVSEGMPRTIIEAMALAMPIIATNVGFISGVIDGKNGILVDVHSPNQLVRSLESLSRDKLLRTSIAENAYQDACNKYSWASVFEQYRNSILKMV